MHPHFLCITVCAHVLPSIELETNLENGGISVLQNLLILFASSYINSDGYVYTNIASG